MRRFLSTSLLALAVLTAGVSLTGCVVVPAHRGYYRGGWVPGHWAGGIWIRGHYR